MLLSGLSTFAIVFVAVGSASWLITPFMFDKVGSLISTVVADFKTCRTWILNPRAASSDSETRQMLLE
jgi:hypothetical protein